MKGIIQKFFGGELASTIDINPQVHVEKVVILVNKLLQTC